MVVVVLGTRTGNDDNGNWAPEVTLRATEMVNLRETTMPTVMCSGTGNKTKEFS